MIENINIDKDKIIFNSTDGKAHLVEYFLEQCEPTKIVIQEFLYFLLQYLKFYECILRLMLLTEPL